MPGGLGAAPIGWRDLSAWQEITGVDLMAWEARALRQLSAEYVGASQDAKDPSAPPPWTSEDAIKRNREVVASKIKSGFGSLKLDK